MLWWTLYQAEGVLKGSWLRRKALAECMRHIHYEAGPRTIKKWCLVYTSCRLAYPVSMHALL